MKTASRALSVLLSLHFALYPQAGAAQTAAVASPERPRVAFSLVKVMATELDRSPETYFPKEELSLSAVTQEKQITSVAIEDIKRKLKDKSYSFDEIKQSIQRELLVEEQNKLIELKVLLSKASPDKLDKFFGTSMAIGLYSPEFRYSYASAYNQLEKIEVLMQMLRQDLSIIRSQNAKHIGLMERTDILKHLEATGGILSAKDDKLKKTMIIILTVAAAGLITWGIVSASKARFEKNKKKANSDYDKKEKDAKADHDLKVKTLEESFAERQRLREQGYVWQVCSTKSTAKTASCTYDFKPYAGDEVCVTHCMKQPETGHETASVESCSSSFIPNNCFVKNPTAAGYDDGYDSGHRRGYDNGYDYAYDRAYDNAYGWAYSNAKSSGYNRGYDDGYDDGFAKATAESGKSGSGGLLVEVLRGQEPDERAEGYKKGYHEGYSYALQLRVGFSY